MKAVFIRSTIGSLVILWLLGAGIGHAEETDHIKTLTVEEATRLAQQKNGRLLLDGRTTPALKAVAALAEMNGHNWNGHLPRFKAVPDGRARSIRRFRTSRENWTCASAREGSLHQGVHRLPGALTPDDVAIAIEVYGVTKQVGP